MLLSYEILSISALVKCGRRHESVWSFVSPHGREVSVHPSALVERFQSLYFSDFDVLPEMVCFYRTRPSLSGSESNSCSS